MHSNANEFIIGSICAGSTVCGSICKVKGIRSWTLPPQLTRFGITTLRIQIHATSLTFLHIGCCYRLCRWAWIMPPPEEEVMSFQICAVRMICRHAMLYRNAYDVPPCECIYRNAYAEPLRACWCRFMKISNMVSMLVLFV